MKKKITYMSIILLLSLAGCKKDFLDARPDKALLIPTTLADFQRILNNEQVIGFSPAINQIASDDYEINADGLLSLQQPLERNSYIWAKDVYEGSTPGDWSIPYSQVYYANVVLEGLDKLNSPDTATANQLKASALFNRAFAIYNLAQVFCKPYNATTGSTDPGIPLRLTADVNEKSVRGTVNQTYTQILDDLNAAASLAPAGQVLYRNIGKPAIYGLLARVLLSMGEYAKAGEAAGQSLQLKSDLIDYNMLSPDDYRPFPLAPTANPEALYYAQLASYSIFNSPYTIVAPDLYASYDETDLRKTIFFNDNGDGTASFKGTYGGNEYLFGGGATDEMYLIRAEAFARDGQTASALNDLNTLLIKRYRAGTFTPVTATSADAALQKILLERRKELFARGLRWTDLRRLNKDPTYAKTLERDIDGKKYVLTPNDIRYVFPIPDVEIRLSGFEQNPR